ncbi:hypothetical protein K1X76_05515 [bacterium]|nr:hypothetical protein [bacterium]
MESTHHIGLEAFLSSFRAGALVAIPQGKVIFTNPVFDQLFSHRLEEVSSDNIEKFFASEDLLLKTWKNVLDNRGTYTLWDININVGSKIDEILGGLPPSFMPKKTISNFGPEEPSFFRYKKMDIDMVPLLDPNSSIEAVCFLFYDRTSIQPFEEHKKRLDRIEYLKVIASGLAHEIKNPLSGIKGAVQLLAREVKGNEELQEYTRIILDEVTRVDRLMVDLLHFTKPKKYKKKSVNINRILHDLALIQKTHLPKSVTLLEEFDPSLPEINADPEALSQVFLNLVKNAVESLNGHGRVVLRSRFVTNYLLKKGNKKRQVLSVDVEDTGCGIDSEALKQIFVPFYTSKDFGTGLGLPVCHQIIEEHEGDIQVHSTKGKGSRFTVYLPL